MDLVSHTVVGVSVGQAFFRRSRGPEAVTALAWASILADFDGLPLLSGSPVAVLFRGTFGHSLLLLPFLCFGLASFLKWRYPEVSFGDFFWLSALGSSLHLALDALGAHGPQLWWPLSARRAELSILYGIDAVLLFWLVLPFLAAASARGRERLQALCRLSLAGAVAYLVVCVAGRARAAAVLNAQLRGPELARVFPEPLGPRYWRGVGRQSGRYSVFWIDALSEAASSRSTVATEPAAPAVSRARQTEMGRRLDAFMSAPVWNASEQDGGTLVSAYDLRSQSLFLGPEKLVPFLFFAVKGGEIETLGWLGSRKR